MAENNESTMELAVEKYNIQDKWMEKIAAKYLDVTNINHLKVGLFGYLNEIIATGIRYNIAHRNFLYDEAFLNTACLTKSIFNKAKSYNYEIKMATPASLTVSFSIRQSDLFQYGTRILDDYTQRYTDNYTFRISTDDIFFLGNYQFIIENDIVIHANKQKDGSYAYTSMYDRSNTMNNKGIFSEDTSPYVTTWVDRNTAYEDIISLKFNIYQAVKNNITFENFSSDLSESLFFDVPYRNNLCYFDVVYETQTKSEYLSKYFNETFTPDDEYYCYYYFDSSKLTIYFSGLTNSFQPTINSKLQVYYYTTLGSMGNFNYDGEIGFQFKNDFFNTNIKVSVSKLTESSGGADTPSMKEIKKDLIYEFLTRDNLVTETDLNNFFNKIIDKQVINNSQIKFIKKRDDMFKRSFAGFILLRDKTGLIIPSNTVDIDIEKCNLNKEFHIQSGAIVIYNKEKDKYVFANPNDMEYFNITDESEVIKYDELPTNKNYEEYELVYRLPYALHYKKQPVPRLLAVQNNFNKNLYFDYSYINSNITAEFIVNGLNLTRSAVTYDRLISDDIELYDNGDISTRTIVLSNGQQLSTYRLVFNELGNVNDELSNNKKPIITKINDINTYFLSFNLNTTLPTEYFVTNEGNETNGVICRCIISTEESKPICYFDFKLESYKTMNYTYQLVTNNELNDNNRIKILGSEEYPIYDIDTNLALDYVFIPENARFSLNILTRINDVKNEPLRIIKTPLKNMNDLSNYTMAVTLEGNRTFSLFTILNSIICPEPTFTTSENHMSTNLRQLPVIGNHYLYNYAVFKDFFTTMSLYYEILMDNFDKLETNTSLNVKFYNTYGKSNYFNTPTTNIRLNLIIKLVDSYTQDLDYEIKNFIIKFVEDINESQSKIFAISNLVRELERKFDDIQYIKFMSISDNNNQVIEYDYPSEKEMTKEQLIDYIPEYLNIHIGQNAYIEGKNNFVTGITIEYI